MAPKKKNGRAAAEAAYANLLKDNTALVGDVGEAHDRYVTSLKAAAEAREEFEDKRAAAVKAGAVTSDQLDQMGYKKTAKLPAPPARPEESSEDTPGPAGGSAAAAKTNGAAPAAPQQLASAGAATGEGS